MADSAVGRRGFLWLATHDGLARFDGHHFKVFNIANSPVLSSNRFVHLYAAEDGRLYALTIDGELWRVGYDEIRRARYGSEPSHSEITAVSPEPLCFTISTALICEDKGGGFSEYVAFDRNLDVIAAMPAGENKVWLITSQGRIFLQAGTQRRLLFKHARLPLTNGLPLRISVGANGELTVDLEDGLLQVERNGRLRWLQRDDVNPLNVVQLRYGADGTLWVGTDAGLYAVGRNDRFNLIDAGSSKRGIPSLSLSWLAPDGALWNANGGLLLREDEKVLESAGLVQDVHFGPAGTIWVSTLRDGLYSLSRPRVTVLDHTNGLIADNIYGVARDSLGTIWLGSLGGPVHAIGTDGSVHAYGVAQGLAGPNPWIVAISPDDTVYVGTYAPGLYRKRKAESRFRKVTQPRALAQARTLAICFDEAGQLWLGTTDGVWVLDNEVWYRFWPRHGSVAVRAILHASDGSKWFGTNEGVWRSWRGAVNSVATGVFHGVPVRGLFQADDSAVWASTEGRGLVRISIDDSQVVDAIEIGTAEGLPSDSPHAVLQDGGGNYWINSNQGIFRISADGLTDWLSGKIPALSPLMLGVSDGLAGLEGNGGVQPAGVLDSKGRIWFPSQHGVVRLDPSTIAPRDLVPVPVIDGFETTAGVLPATSDMTLPLGARSLTIHFSAADLTSSNPVRFRYRLSPGEGRWVDIDNQRSISFHSLLPGEYRFELVAANGDGVWGSKPIVQNFVVPARWYETGAFQLSAATAVILIILLVARSRVRLAMRRAVELDKQVRARTQELSCEKFKAEDTLKELVTTHIALAESHSRTERSNRRLADQAEHLERISGFRAQLLADVSHELRTPIMLASMPLKQLSSQLVDKSMADKDCLELSIAQMNRLAVLVDQLLCMVQVEAGLVKLEISSFDLYELVREIVKGFELAADGATVGYCVHCDESTIAIFADRDRVTSVITNLIDNATRYMPADGDVEVHLQLDASNEFVTVAVIDSGPGFDPAMAKKLFQRFYREDGASRSSRGGLGIGLAIARELVELHGGKIGARCRDEGGAEFWFSLPLGGAHIALDELQLEQVERGPLRSFSTSSNGDTTTGEILVVEDHMELANYLGHRLAEFCPTRVVGDAETALQCLRNQQFGMVLSDIVLTGMSGIDLCSLIKSDASFNDLPVLLFSARQEAFCRKVVTRAGADGFLAKPFGFEELHAAVTRVWAGGRRYFGRCRHGTSPENADPIFVPALHAMSDPSFCVGKWANKVFLSDRQLRRRVVELTGRPPVAWLREQRLQHVRQLISSGECRTLLQAGAEAGLDNPGYLYRIYRARFGVFGD